MAQTGIQLLLDRDRPNEAGARYLDVLAGFAVDVWVTIIEGQPVITELRIAPTPASPMPRQGVDSGISKVSVPRLRSRTAELTRDLLDPEATLGEDLTTSGLVELPPSLDRVGDDERQLAALAAKYLELSMETSRAVKALAEIYGAPSEVLHRLIKKARAAGLLEPPPVPGRVGGKLTQRAFELLHPSEG